MIALALIVGGLSPSSSGDTPLTLHGQSPALTVNDVVGADAAVADSGGAGEPGAPASVVPLPEPSTLTLVLLGEFFLFHRRRWSARKAIPL
jgi:hypothetical protein